MGGLPGASGMEAAGEPRQSKIGRGTPPRNRRGPDVRFRGPSPRLLMEQGKVSQVQPLEMEANMRALLVVGAMVLGACSQSGPLGPSDDTLGPSVFPHQMDPGSNSPASTAVEPYTGTLAFTAKSSR